MDNQTDKRVEEIKELVGKVSAAIEETKELREANFGLFYQSGRLGFMDLDAFAKTTKVKLEADGPEQTLEECKEKIDK